MIKSNGRGMIVYTGAVARGVGDKHYAEIPLGVSRTKSTDAWRSWTVSVLD